ncbi:MAG: hypothetical protein NTW59_04075 [Candidatus Diapherotrites archaeon]|nr:hypothetical protein [Candidatus Diapherotrites archaeon]
MKRLLVILLVAALVAFSGCVVDEANVAAKAKQHPSIADFLAEHPGAVLYSTAFSSEQSQGYLAEWQQRCGPQMFAGDYYYVSFKDAGSIAEAWLTQKSGLFACVHRSDDECAANASCDDGVACTRDLCDGVPKKCAYTPVFSCITGDGCCPQGCDNLTDMDCLVPSDECAADTDCDDSDPATADVCSGEPLTCRNAPITECSPGDGYCPAGCTDANDSDCQIEAACTSNVDCNDSDPLTIDACGGEPAACSHTKSSACINSDGLCPDACNNHNDTDCIAESGNFIRIGAKCKGVLTNIDNILVGSGGELNAIFRNSLTGSNNSAFKSYSGKTYKYNSKESSTAMAESLSINGEATYFRQLNEGELKFPIGAVVYTANLGDGIPSANANDPNKLFVSGNNDKMLIPFFGSDAFVAAIDSWNKEVELVSNALVWHVSATDVASNLAGKDGVAYNITVANCGGSSAVFSLNDGTKMVESQSAKTGDILFEGKLQRLTMLSYLNRDSSSGKCNYEYVTGDYLETLKDGQPLPQGSGGDWSVSLQFSSNRLQKITVKNSTSRWFAKPLLVGQSMKVTDQPGSAANGFCTLDFYGLFK